MQRPDPQADNGIATLQRLVERHRRNNIVVLELDVELRNGIVKDILWKAALLTMGSVAHRLMQQKYEDLGVTIYNNIIA